MVPDEDLTSGFIRSGLLLTEYFCDRCPTSFRRDQHESLGRLCIWKCIRLGVLIVPFGGSVHNEVGSDGVLVPVAHDGEVEWTTLRGVDTL